MLLLIYFKILRLFSRLHKQIIIKFRIYEDADHLLDFNSLFKLNLYFFLMFLIIPFTLTMSTCVHACLYHYDLIKVYNIEGVFWGVYIIICAFFFFVYFSIYTILWKYKKYIKYIPYILLIFYLLHFYFFIPIILKFYIGDLSNISSILDMFFKKANCMGRFSSFSQGIQNIHKHSFGNDKFFRPFHPDLHINTTHTIMDEIHNYKKSYNDSPGYESGAKFDFSDYNNHHRQKSCIELASIHKNYRQTFISAVGMPLSLISGYYGSIFGGAVGAALTYNTAYINYGTMFGAIIGGFEIAELAFIPQTKVLNIFLDNVASNSKNFSFALIKNPSIFDYSYKNNKDELILSYNKVPVENKTSFLFDIRRSPQISDIDFNKGIIIFDDGAKLQSNKLKLKHDIF